MHLGDIFTFLSKVQAIGTTRASKDLCRFVVEPKVSCHLIHSGQTGAASHADNIGVILWHDWCAVRASNVDIVARCQLITGTRELPNINHR